MIITLCGSARFEPWFHAWNEALSLSGHCVFGLGCYPFQHKGEKNWYSEEEKLILDTVHMSKIKESHAILVLNLFAYIGESTLREIEFAKMARKQIHFLESWGTGFGIGKNHFASVQERAAFYKVPEGFGSPIDTSLHRPIRRDPWELLPDNDGSNLRYNIVQRLYTLNPLKGISKD